MKNILLCLLIPLTLKANGQISGISSHQMDSSIAFLKNVSWKGVLEKAREKDKAIFIDVSTTWCVPCKKMEKEIFPLKGVKTFYNHNFINYQVDAEKGEGVKIANHFNVHAYPTYLFVDRDGNLLYKGAGYNSDPKVFINMGKKALRMQTDSLNLQYYKKEYSANKNNTVFLRDYLQLLYQQGLPGDSLLDHFVALLSDKELLDSINATLIVNMVETCDSKAFDAIIQNQNAFASAVSWHKTKFNRFSKGRPPERNLAIALEQMIMTDFLTAIGSQNKTLFKKAIPSAESIQNASPKFTTITIPLTKVKFYALAEDTIHLQDAAFPFADSLMQVPSHSIDSMDKIKYGASQEKYLAPQMDSSRAAYFKSHKEKYKHIHSEYIGNILNEIAKDYCIFMYDPDKLKSALQWSRRAIELNPAPKIRYTNARLLYKLGRKRDAITALKTAITKLQTLKEDQQLANYKKDLAKMENGTL